MAEGDPVEPRLERRVQPDRYGVALLLVIATIIGAALAGDSDWGRAATIAVMGATLLFILATSQAHRRTFRLAAVLVGAAVATSVAAAVVGSEEAPWLPVVIGALLALVAPISILRRLLQTERISGRTVLGALCLYLLAGLFFAFVYAAIGAIDGSFFVQTNDPKSLDYVYFSFVTLATVGYGDFTAAGDLGRMLAVSEALMGQLYLVSIVALLVANMGRTREPRRIRKDRSPDG